MKKLLSILLTFMVCLTLVGVSTNRVNAEDEGETKTKEVVEEEKKEKQQEVLKDEIVEVKQVEKTPEENLVNENAVDYTIYVDCANKIFRRNGIQGSVITPTGLTFVGDDLVMTDFKFETTASQGLSIGSVTGGKTVNLVVNGNCNISLLTGATSSDKYGINCNGKLKITKGSGAENKLTINMYTGSKNNVGINANGDLTIEMDGAANKNIIAINMNSGVNGLAKTIYGLCSTQNIYVKGNHNLEGIFTTYAEDNVFVLADKKIVTSKVDNAQNADAYGPHISFGSAGNGEYAYYVGGLVAENIELNDSSFDCVITGGDFSYCIDADTIAINGVGEYHLTNTSQAGTIFNVAPTFGTNVYAIGSNVNTKHDEKFNPDNIDVYWYVEIDNAPVNTVSYVNQQGHTATFASDAVFDTEEVTLPAPTETGYSFDGWYESPTFEGQKVTSSYTPTKDTTLYAKWNLNPVVAKYSLGGGVLNETYNQQLKLIGATATSWEITEGSLPTGLSLNANTGVVSGTPTVKETKDIKVAARYNDGGTEKTTAAVPITIRINEVTIPNFVADPAKAVMLLKEYADEVSYEEENGYPVITFNNLNYETDNPLGMEIPQNATIKLYGTNTIKVTGFISNAYTDMGLQGVSANMKLSYGVFIGGDTRFISGDKSNPGTLNIITAPSEKIDKTIGAVLGYYATSDGSSFINLGVMDKATVNITSGNARTSSYGLCSGSAGRLVVNGNSKLNIEAEYTDLIGEVNSSTGVYGISKYVVTDGGEVYIKGGDSAAYQFYTSAPQLNAQLEAVQAFSIDDLNNDGSFKDNNLEEKTNVQLTEAQVANIEDNQEDYFSQVGVQYNNGTCGIVYGSSSADNKDPIDTVLSSNGSTSTYYDNYYLDDGTGVVRRMLITAPENSHSLFFNKNDGKFYKDINHTELYEGGGYSYSNGILTLNNFNFTTDAAIGLYFNSDITINLKAGTTNNIAVAKGKVGKAIFCDGKITIAGSGKLNVSSDQSGIEAINNINLSGGNTRIVSKYGIVTYQGDINVNGGDNYIYGDYYPLFSFKTSTSKLNLNNGLINLDTNTNNGSLVSNFEISVDGGYPLKHDLYIGDKKVETVSSRATFVGKDVGAYKSGDESKHNWFRTVKKGSKNYYTLEFDATNGIFKNSFTNEEADIDKDTYSYDSSSKTLTLNNFKYTSYSDIGVYIPTSIKIKLVGTNEITLMPETITKEVVALKCQGNDAPIGIEAPTFEGDGYLAVSVEPSNRCNNIIKGYGILSQTDQGANKILVFNSTDTIDVSVIGVQEAVGIYGNYVYMYKGKLYTNVLGSKNNKAIAAKEGIDVDEDTELYAIAGNGLLGYNIGLESEGYINIDGGNVFVIIDGTVADSNDKNCGIVALGEGEEEGIIITNGSVVNVQTSNSPYESLTGIYYKGPLTVKDSYLSVVNGDILEYPNGNTDNATSVNNIGIKGIQKNATDSTTFENSSVFVMSGEGTASYGIEVNENMNVTGSTAVVYGAKGATSVGIRLDDNDYQKNAVLNINDSELNAYASRGIGTSSFGGTSTGIYSDDVVITKSKVHTESGRSRLVSSGVYATNSLNMNSGSLSAKTTAGAAWNCAAVSVGKTFNYVDGDITLEVKGTPAKDSTTMALYASSVSEKVLDKNFVKIPTGGKVDKYMLYDQDYVYTFYDSNNEIALTAANNTNAPLPEEMNCDNETGVCNIEVTQGSGKEVEAHLIGTDFDSLDYDKSEIKGDGVELDNYFDYSLADGSVYVTFTEDYMNRLSSGKHTFDVVLTDKDGVHNYTLYITVKKPDTPTPTPTPKKDESCEKVIGPTWHWNNKKGICEDSGSVKTDSR